MGLREQKKEQTRRLLTDTARRLFAEQGFERVTVTQIAKAARVAPATVFNYFPTKEDLFYGPLDAFGARLVAAVRDREPGTTPLAAAERFLLAANASLAAIETGDAEVLDRLTTLNRIIADSPALLARERQAMAAHAEALTEVLAGSAADPTEAVVARSVANAIVGVHHALITWVRRRTLAGHTEGLAAEVRAATTAATARLATGLGDWEPA